MYTDGACLGNPGPGGWAWAVPGGRYASGAEALTTNQRMEIRAVWEAVSSLQGPLEVVSDSTYVVNCFRDRWWEGWLARGWLTAAKKPVANRDLWEPLVDAVRSDPGRVSFTWVKGHSTDPINDLVDRLAADAARTQQGRTGEGVPEGLGGPDVVTSPDTDPRVPEGHRLVVAGHRPPALGGYEDNPVADGVRHELARILAAKREMQPHLVVLTGLGLGAEQLGGEAAAEAGVPYVAVLAFPEPEAAWSAASRDVYRELLTGAAATVVRSDSAPTSRQAAGMAIGRRDDWLLRQADGAIVVWDGKQRGLGEAVRSLERRVPDELWIIPPEG